MDKAQLLALADRVEALTDPDRDVDRAIATAIRPEQPADKWAGRRQAKNAKPYTASIDAAIMLVPEGALGSMETYDSNGIYPEHVRASAWVQGSPRCFAATPALALTAASLRAMAGGDDVR